MSKTSVPSGDAKAKLLYQERLFRDTTKKSFFVGKSMMSESDEAIIQVKRDLEKERGEKIRFALRMRLSGAGRTNGQTLEGYEEKLNLYTMDLTLAQYRHGVRDDGELDRQRAMYDISSEQKAALKDWGTEKIDQLVFDMLGIGSGATSDPTKVFYLNSSGVPAASSAATAKAGLHATNSKVTPAFVRALKTWAMNGGNRTYVPLRPIPIDGKPHYVLLTHDDCLYDLKNNSTYEQYLRDAEIRGKDNPLFSGAVALIDGVIIHSHENCAIANDGGGTTVPWAKGVFLGQQAGVWGWGKAPKLVERNFDYGEEEGVAWTIIAGTKKSQFNSLDYGSVGVWLARTDVSGL